jgi:hypothetical protein
MNQNTQKKHPILCIIQYVHTLIHIIGIYSFLKLDKYYISCLTVNFLNLKFLILC